VGLWVEHCKRALNTSARCTKEELVTFDFEHRIDLRQLIGLNKFSLCNVEYGLFASGNKRATFSTPSQSRSESCIVINPNDPSNMVGASKKFIDPAIYLFTLGIV
jgi:hypothetical protein